MRVQILDTNGEKIKEISTGIFDDTVRIDIIRKVTEAEKTKHPYSPKYQAGMDRSASGLQRKRRHVWKSDRGRGLSRIPRKIIWRRGTQFNWIGAVIPSARSGRRAHSPKGTILLKKINKKENLKALFSALAYVSSVEDLKKKYTSLNEKKIKKKLPIIVEEKIFELKTKQFFESLRKILDEFYPLGIQDKKIRAGKGKLRGRKNKKNAGLLFVIGNDEELKIKGIDVLKTNQLTVSDLADNGARLTIFSEKAVGELEKLKGIDKIKKESKKTVRKTKKTKIRKEKREKIKKN
ncbi:50S ribosomal protein L4 [Candidatus Pacearchaeota archaeon]|nr:50S ribosomal protein L4 [Candidatus Pacearchaeota archaeon]MBD3282923.1 50S ribosomal protein L4 [Candidatus Pacearchaeota archaeon]